MDIFPTNSHKQLKFITSGIELLTFSLLSPRRLPTLLMLTGDTTVHLISPRRSLGSGRTPAFADPTPNHFSGLADFAF